MRGLPQLSTLWRALLALLLLLGLLWLASNPFSQSPNGVLGLFVFSLFISLGFILFGQQRLDPAPSMTSSDDQHLA